MTQRSEIVNDDGRVENTDHQKRRSINVALERGLAFILLHQLLEALQPNDFAQRNVNRISAIFRLEYLHSLVGQVRVQPDGSHGYSHSALRTDIYTIPKSYIRVERIPQPDRSAGVSRPVRGAPPPAAPKSQKKPRPYPCQPCHNIP